MIRPYKLNWRLLPIILCQLSIILACTKKNEILLPYINTAATPQYATKVSDGMTNCYIVAPNTELIFPVSRAYIYTGTNFTTMLHVGETYTDGFDAAVVWDDAGVINGMPSVSGFGNNAIVKVTTTSVSGNALVKICKTGENIPVWSYHIWVTDYDPIQNTFTNMDKNDRRIIFMDRNLGATESGNTLSARGLMYQWGRKDPFPGGSTTAGYNAMSSFNFGSKFKVSGSTNAGAIIESIEKPTTFFAAVSNKNWLPALDNELWDHSGSKTIYDPCPAGWRIPANTGMSSNTSPWYGFRGQTFTVDDTATAYWSSSGTNTLYPAAGYRDHADGRLNYSGSYGCYWSASPYSNSSNGASELYFDNNASIAVSNYACRAYGQSVRCVQE
ncbi:MAG: fibrobacter succinogenes major paralogous domain-containing protein [Mediterranea sp.]|jgi:uncharacterized protein (TIGR02145 family)|nr:fibrobacter succinogenes major paralogous domain-containing protein [Mediterranea sp.]